MTRQRHTYPRWLAGLGLVISILSVSGIGSESEAAPFIPTNDGAVLEAGLPTADPRMREIRALKRDHDDQPDDLDRAMRLANRQLAMGVAEADPRFVGYAEATLAPWWSTLSDTPDLPVLRARILQAQHNFDDAARDLRRALVLRPDHQQALLVLAGVDVVTGDFAEARDLCARLAGLRSDGVASACRASVAAVDGHAAEAAALLRDAVLTHPMRDRVPQAWALTILAEIAVQQDDPVAGDYFAEAVALDKRNVYTLSVYADYLLRQQQYDRVMALLTGFERIDPLFLRFTVAALAQGDPEAPRYRAEMTARLVAARLQGDRVHLRDGSRFALEIEHDCPLAVSLAEQNWISHKTPTDARTLLAAARQCQRADVAKPVADFVEKTQLEDVSLHHDLINLGYENNTSK